MNLCNKEHVSIIGSSLSTSTPGYAGNDNLVSVLIAFHTLQEWLLKEVSLLLKDVSMHSEAHNIPKE